MEFVTKISKENESEIMELIQSGITLLMVNDNGEKFIVDRAELNNRDATSLSCQDLSINTFEIAFDFLDEFESYRCYQKISLKIVVN